MAVRNVEDEDPDRRIGIGVLRSRHRDVQIALLAGRLSIDGSNDAKDTKDTEDRKENKWTLTSVSLVSFVLTQRRNEHLDMALIRCTSSTATRTR
jgi:hypothetical protein